MKIMRTASQIVLAQGAIEEVFVSVGPKELALIKRTGVVGGDGGQVEAFDSAEELQRRYPDDPIVACIPNWQALNTAYMQDAYHFTDTADVDETVRADIEPGYMFSKPLKFLRVVSV